MKVRRDRNVIAFFDERDGTKIRIGLGRYTKASRPELVDIKITDYCAFNCSFCYQGSTIKGKHATTENLVRIVSELQKAKVFEVALGGGEPTDIPGFIDLLKLFRERGIVPNYTTKSLVWTRKYWSEVNPLIGAFAYSAETVEDLERADHYFTEIPRERINIHYVMGLDTREAFLSFMAAAHRLNFRVTLLGYKTVGRGSEVEHQGHSWWLSVVRILQELGRCPTFSIDTPLAEEYNDELREFLPSYSYHTREGAFSMYIDAVAMKMGASSFENLDDLQPFDDRWRSRYQAL